MNAPLANTHSVVFAVEPFSVVYPEMQNLLHLHYDEIAPHQDIFKFNPDVDAYLRMDKAGTLCIVTARAQGLLIGYIVMMINRHLHYKDTFVATDDVHFIHPLYRKGSLGLRLIAAAEKEMVLRKVKVMILRTKVAHNHGVLFERMGYTPLDIVYSKALMES